jgi:glycosyltransferase involved in cell wall biosynthesis
VKLRFVVQRYGENVAGGSEAACRAFAEQMLGRGHDVEVVTSTAQSYVDWSGDHAEGWCTVNGVSVLRLPPARRRDNSSFGELNRRAVFGPQPVPLSFQRHWMRGQGPDLVGLDDALDDAGDQTVTVFFTYLYMPTVKGVPMTRGRTVMHPTAHHEPPFRLGIFDAPLRLVDRFSFFTEEEQSLMVRRLQRPVAGEVIAMGVDLDRVGDGAAFRARYALGDDPYLVFLGRLDPGKGSLEAYEFFRGYRRRSARPVKLVLMGDPVIELADDPGVIRTGFVDEQTKHDALAGCLALLQPSYFESFSIALIEAWAQRRPALVQGRCDVLRGQAKRSAGALAYEGFAEFEAALDLLLEDQLLGDRLGAAGLRYAESRYRWPDVIQRYEQMLEQLLDSKATPAAQERA